MKRHAFALVAAASMVMAGVACGDDDDDTTTTTTGSGGSTTTTTTDGGGGSGGDGGDGGGGSDACSIAQIATDAGLTSLVAAVDAAGLVDTVNGLENATIFAPTDDAFAALLGALNVQLTDLTPEQLIPILTYHIAGSVIDSSAAIAAAAGDGNFDTLGGNVTIAGDANAGLVLDGGDAAPANINLDLIDVETCNGTIVHVIDAVLLPTITEVVTTQADYSELAGLIVASDGTDTIVNLLNGYADPNTPGFGYTLFAPTNMAITDGVDFLMNNGGVPDAAGLTPILTYHALPAFTPAEAALGLGANTPVPTVNGANMTVSGGAGVTIAEGLEAPANVTIVDVFTANGVIHRIDQILVPPAG